MNFPIIERRKTTNRRTHSPDRRQVQNSYFFQNEQRNNSERRNETDRRILELDRDTMLFSIKQSEIKVPSEKKSKIISFCSAILIPLSIGISSFLIAINQDKNAQHIAKGQQENAQKLLVLISKILKKLPTPRLKPNICNTWFPFFPPLFLRRTKKQVLFINAFVH